MQAAAETIVAIATPPGRGGVGIIRASGPAVPTLAATLLGRPPRPRYAHWLRLADAAGEPIDEGLLLYFPAPASYTGEHVLELQLHGAPVVLRLALRRLCALGCRPARPGEFSERAFLNGRLDLAQAEAVADLIAAGSEAAARAAIRSLSGEFSRRVEALQTALVEVRMQIEALIDFPDEDLDVAAESGIVTRLDRLEAMLATLVQAAARGRRLNDGLSLLILGAPNAGKSSLLNRLSGQERAIVTDIPGTTRDLLHESVEVDGLPLSLIDTAGLRDSADPVEQEGVRRARAAIAEADHLLLVLDDRNAEAEAEALAPLAKQRPHTWLLNKIDLSGRPAGLLQYRGSPAVAVSANTGAGLSALYAHLKELLGRPSEAGSFSARERHLEALARVTRHVCAARALFGGDLAIELVAEELLLAQDALGEITGRYLPDQLLGEIFGRFCIGK